MRRRRAGSDELRERLLDAARAEFSENGYEGASTRAIARRAGAHQPQINYHFDSKAALWRAVVDEIMGDLDAALVDVDLTDARSAFAEMIRRLVRFSAEHPELYRIMIQEGTSDSDRLRWIVDTHLRRRSATLVALWEAARREGGTAAVDADLIHYVLIGASSLIHANSAEARLLGIDPEAPEFVDRHADTLVALLLPGPPGPAADPGGTARPAPLDRRARPAPVARAAATTDRSVLKRKKET